MTLVEMRNVCNILVEKPEGKRLLGGYRMVHNPIITFRNIGPLRCFSIWLFLAVCLISFQDFPLIFAFTITVVLHATFGLPRLRLPCGFRSKASHAILLGIYKIYGTIIPTSDAEFPNKFWLRWFLSTGRCLICEPARICIKFFGGIY
jgi:hypothetical protein